MSSVTWLWIIYDEMMSPFLLMFWEMLWLTFLICRKVHWAWTLFLFFSFFFFWGLESDHSGQGSIVPQTPKMTGKFAVCLTYLLIVVIMSVVIELHCSLNLADWWIYMWLVYFWSWINSPFTLLVRGNVYVELILVK